MIVSANRLRSIGWIALLLVCFAMVMVMAFRVNALRSQVHRAEAQIVALRQEKVYLETEMETRANQQQLKTWNDVEFGYVAPGADQYLENERQLAVLSQPEQAGAPEPIRVASMDDAVVAAAAFPAMVNPLTGQPATEAGEERTTHADHATATAALGDSLAKVRHFADDASDSKPGKPDKDRKVASAAKSKNADGKTPSKAASKKPTSLAKASTTSTLSTKSGDKKHAGTSASANNSSRQNGMAKAGAKAGGKAAAAATRTAASSSHAKAGATTVKLARAEPRKTDLFARSSAHGSIKIALKDVKRAK